MYKVLDVREYDSIRECSLSSGGYGSHPIHMDKTHYVVAICENTTHGKRVRFDFYPGHKDTFLGEDRYYGYAGEYELIVPGDIIDIKETSTYKEVWRVKEC